MHKESIPLNQLDLQPFTAFGPGGILLVVGSESEDANVMTIGWGMFGIMWRKPMVMVMVRPTRHTWNLINKAPDFTVNWLADERRSALELCGTRSGRGARPGGPPRASPR
ncbi:MAG TPA: hypothetical protein GYA10_07300 [Alphaproteobacteria bacterium]|nr:hypothetical protein [Alphaproteobacteria bacterium]